VHLQGIQQEQLSLDAMSPEQFVKCYIGNDIWALTVVQTVSTSPIEEVPHAINQVLQEFPDVFEDPNELPTHRAYDHSIPLLPESISVNNIPYRYSPLHKDEIERQVRNLLDTGLITTSTSPFASLVLLVQKKDGTWCFCVDYRRLNSVTVKNKFRMPLIVKILDELTASTCFSRLDFKACFHQV
jgi:hypothetical protein